MQGEEPQVARVRGQMLVELDQPVRIVGPDGSKVVVQAALGDHTHVQELRGSSRGKRVPLQTVLSRGP